MDEVGFPSPCYRLLLNPRPLLRPSRIEDELENGLSPFLERINLFLPHGMVWCGEERRFWWMKVQVMSRLCGYTSAGAGPVSLGLVVTMLALLLTCRGQCRGDMTNIHFTLATVHSWGIWVAWVNGLSTSDRTLLQPTNQPTSFDKGIQKFYSTHFCKWSLAL